MPTPIVVDEHVYLVSDEGIATCLNRLTGEQIWKERLGGDFSSSPIYADGKLYFCNREGKVFVVRPGNQFELLATNVLDSRIMATPAVTFGSIIIRTEQSLYRFGKQ